MKLELTQEETTLVVNALNTHLREHGIQIVSVVAAIIEKLRSAAEPQPGLI